ncbi:1388_t:CDS:2, partial [Acaulospora morrowiae]
MVNFFYNKLITDIYQLLDGADNYDVNIKVGENTEIKEFRAHSVILRARSPYFKRALSGSWATIKDRIILFNKPNISPNSFALILKYFYSGILNLENILNSDILDLLIASDELLIGELTDCIQDHFIKKQYSWVKSNFTVIFQAIFQLPSCKKLVDYCLDSICIDPEPFFASDDFTLLDKNIILEVIKRDDLEIEEPIIWDHIIKWGIYRTPGIGGRKLSEVMSFSKNNFMDLKESIIPFISHIRFYDISLKDFHNKVRPFRKIIPKPLYEDVIAFLMAEEEPKYKKLPARIRPFIAESKFVKRKHVAVISNWIERKDSLAFISKENQYQFTLLYSGTRDGFDVGSFHQKVNDKGRVVAFIKIKDSGTIVGGFNATGWGNDQLWINNNDHFIFSFKGIDDRIIGRSSSVNGIFVNNKDILAFGNSDLILNGKYGKCKRRFYDEKILDTNSFIAEELE